MGGGAVVAGAADAGRASQYHGKMTPAVLMVTVIAAAGGLIFGYDNGITGGVISMPDFQQRFFPSVFAAEAQIRAAEAAGVVQDPFCKYDDHILQLFTSSLFLAGAFSALISSFTSKHYGRKFSMTVGGLGFCIGTVLVTAAVHVSMLVIGRVILGIGVGFATQSAPLFISEMAPYNLRGSLNIVFQLAVTIGILVAQLINYGTQNLRPYGWRISLGLAGVPGLMLFLGSLLLPDTPNSLVERGHVEKGREVLQRIRGVPDVEAEFEDIMEAARISQLYTNVQSFKHFFGRRRFRPQLVITIVIPIFQQFTGINAIIFYAPQLFGALGQGTAAALQATVVIGAVNVASTVVSIILVDRVGRKALLMEAGVQMFCAEVITGALLAWAFSPGGPGLADAAVNKAIIAMICIYISSFAWSWGPLGWLIPSEIQPLETRAAGTAVNTCVNLLMTFLIGQVFLTMLCSMKFGVFFFFAGFVFIMTLFALFFFPETKGVPIEELDEVVIGQHWFWRRVRAGTRRGPSHVDLSKLEQGHLSKVSPRSTVAVPVGTVNNGAAM